MHRKSSIFFSALMLTAVHLLLRLAGTSFQVYLSGQIGAAGIGLLQLTMSVGSFAMVAGMAGIRTATMYLTAEEIGRRAPEHIPSVLSGCVRYSLIAGGSAGLILYILAPELAAKLVGKQEITDSLRLFAAFLPVCCLNGVFSGYFTAAGRIGMLAAVEVAEQLFSMAVTVSLLINYAGTHPHRACESVIMGSSAGACMTLVCLVVMRLREKQNRDQPIPVAKRLTGAAIPLALADLMKNGITTTEHLMVPRRLARNPAIADPLAAFGLMSGMVFPVLMFPACILYGLADLLIPELARCAAVDNSVRIRYLVKRSLKVSSLYGLCFAGAMILCALPLCRKLYGQAEAGLWLQRYALMLPMLYCDALVDAMTKGLGQQKLCVLFNIISSGLDVVFLYFLLPVYGMTGYYISFLLTHGLNFCLSLGTLLRITNLRIAVLPCILGGFGGAVSLILAAQAPSLAVRIPAYILSLGCILALLGILGKEDALWLAGILRGHKKEKSPVSV